MSFNAKNLSYEAKEPAFLQRLKSQYGGANSRENPQQRPKRLRNDDDDDAPTYVEEGSHDVISKEEYEAMLRGDDPDAEAENNAEGETKAAPSGDVLAEPTKGDGPKVKQNVAGIGGPKKRKQGKVVGDEAADEGEGDGAEELPERKSAVDKPKQKKKKKKVKLSFDEPDGD